MSRWQKILAQMRRSRSNVRFNDLCRIIEHMGYTLERTRGSHHSYRRQDYPIINLQKSNGGKAKPYQVDQILDILDTTDIEIEE